MAVVFPWERIRSKEREQLDEIRSGRSVGASNPVVDYRWFVRGALRTRHEDWEPTRGVLYR